MLGNLQEDLKKAQLARDKVKVSTLRLLLSEIKNEEIKKGGQLNDQDLVTVIQREVKKRKEAAEGFRKGEREQSAQKEESELEVLQAYLPEQISNEELIKLVEDTISEEKPSLQDMGKIIRLVIERANGRVDGGVVAGIVKEKLS